MAVSEKIQKHVEKLPASLQEEVLDFTKYLLAKSECGKIRQERKLWSDLSLSYAMRVMQDEETPLYTISDLKVVFS